MEIKLRDLQKEWESSYEQSKKYRIEEIEKVNNFINLCESMKLKIPKWVYEAKEREISYIKGVTNKDLYEWVLSDIEERLNKGEEGIWEYYYTQFQ